MIATEFKKYLTGMDEYIKKLREEPKEKSLKFLMEAGIVDKEGKLMPQYKEQ
ncbi:hypothetical protein [Paenibacillus sp. URB8-2]|uniref:hypothetical protein n=1 Tax=Paenibacillus sp. URB8-2 TaxID=2741301 RepID=UPI0015BFF5EB|nr:hypothetical protein [Paenibacillus sp. URB8-2]BCG58514.1 hypothetical protein PUR_19390 [Paenibacillus sp. URB8-2]